MSDERLKQLEAAAWREWEESWGNTESGAHYSGFTAGYRVAEADLTAQLAAVTAGRDAATKRVATLENDLEHALASVGAFRQAIEDAWAKSAGESGDDGFIVSYVIPVGVLHRAIGLARGTDAGGKLLTRLAASEVALAASERERVAMAGAWERKRAIVGQLERQIRATYGIIHEGLHGGKPTDLDHQEACEMPSCRNARAALAAASEGE